MASPVDSARQGTNVTTAATTHNVNVGSPAGGVLLIVMGRFPAAPGAVTFTGYTAIAGLDPNTADASDDSTFVWYRVADGTEGATDPCNPTNSVKGAYLCWEITGAEDPTVQAPEVGTIATGTTTANSNPGATTPTGGSKDYLFLAMEAHDGEGSAATVAPTNYSNLVTANSGTGGAVATNCIMGGASRQLTASTEDPGAFTNAAPATGWTAFTIAIHPATIPDMEALLAPKIVQEQAIRSHLRSRRYG